jgi:enamine deaminase RidA (YjgF/YER057c/UK114 family)
LKILKKEKLNMEQETEIRKEAPARQLINPTGTELIYQSMQFSQAVRVDDTMWVSGQVGMDEQLHMGEGLDAQARQAFRNLERVLVAAGASLADVVELVTYHTDMDRFSDFARVKSEFFPKDYPAWTAVGVKALVMPGLLVEIRATAVIGSSRETF